MTVIPRTLRRQGSTRVVVDQLRQAAVVSAVPPTNTSSGRASTEPLTRHQRLQASFRPTRPAN